VYIKNSKINVILSTFRRLGYTEPTFNYDVGFFQRKFTALYRLYVILLQTTRWIWTSYLILEDETRFEWNIIHCQLHKNDMLYFYNDPQPTKLENLNYRGLSRVPFEFRVYLSTECCVPRESFKVVTDYFNFIFKLSKVFEFWNFNNVFKSFSKYISNFVSIVL